MSRSPAAELPSHIPKSILSKESTVNMKCTSRCSLVKPSQYILNSPVVPLPELICLSHRCAHRFLRKSSITCSKTNELNLNYYLPSILHRTWSHFCNLLGCSCVCGNNHARRIAHLVRFHSSARVHRSRNQRARDRHVQLSGHVHQSVPSSWIKSVVIQTTYRQ